jgi:hypothetical protein
MVPPSKAQSLYVDARVCRPELASCAAENTSAFTFLKCSGLDATKVTSWWGCSPEHAARPRYHCSWKELQGQQLQASYCTQ